MDRTELQRWIARYELAWRSPGTTALVDVKADKDCATPVYDFSAGARAWSYHE